MKYNKITSIMLLLTCVFVSLGLGLVLRKNAVVEGAKFKLKSLGKLVKKSGLSKIANKGLNLGKGALAFGAGQIQKGLSKSRKNANQAVQELQKQIKQPYDTLKEWSDTEKNALEAEILAEQTKQETDIIKSKNLRKTAEDLYKMVLESIKHAETIAVASAMSNPVNHIKKIKSRTLKILNSVDTDENKLTKIMNNIVLPNEPNKFEIITNIKNTANTSTMPDSEKLVKLRSLVS